MKTRFHLTSPYALLAVLILAISSSSSFAGVTKHEKTTLRAARERGWLLRDDYPTITSSDSAERAKGDFSYYAKKSLKGVIEREPPGSGLKKYFSEMDFNYSQVKEPSSRAIISAVGDLMTQARLTMESSPNLYDYPAEFIFGADFATGNLETTVNFNKGYSGFPLFNANKTMFDVLTSYHGKRYDLLVTANNHMFDLGIPNVLSTLDALDQYGIKHVGTARSEEERDEFPIVSIKGIKVAFLAYDYGVNKRKVPEDKFYGNLIYLNSLIPGKLDPSLIFKQIREAKTRGADVVWLNLHWGAEWELYPPVRNVSLAHEFVDAGADVIIGHHPHCLQPMERYVAKDGREAFIAYSLGNLTFNYTFIPHAMMAGAVRVHLAKAPEGQGRVEKIEFLPTFHYNNSKGQRIIPVDDSTIAIANDSFPLPLNKRIRGEIMINQFHLHSAIMPKNVDQILPANELRAYKEVEREIYGNE